MYRFWVIWNGGTKRLDSPTVLHDSYMKAKAEAVRLARLAPESTFYIMEAFESVQVQKELPPPVISTRLTFPPEKSGFE